MHPYMQRHSSGKQIAYIQGLPRLSQESVNTHIPKSSVKKKLASFFKKMTDTTLNCNGLKAGKYNKPLLERQRRARINKSLEQIKELILSSLYEDDPKTFAEKNNERMDKAEILEFAVDFIKHQKLMPYGARPTRTNSPPTTQEQVIHTRLQYLTSLPAPPMPYTDYLASNRLKIEPQQAQPWKDLVRCTDPCCVQYHGNISPIPSPTLSKTIGSAEKVNERIQVNESSDYSHSVWRPW